MNAAHRAFAIAELAQDTAPQPPDLAELAELWPKLDDAGRSAVAAGLAPVLAVARVLAAATRPPEDKRP